MNAKKNAKRKALPAEETGDKQAAKAERHLGRDQHARWLGVPAERSRDLGRGTTEMVRETERAQCKAKNISEHAFTPNV